MAYVRTDEYKTDDIEIYVNWYRVDGAQVFAYRYNGDEWAEMYNMRVIADSLYELLDGALYECGVGDDARMGMLETWGVELPDDDDDE